MARGCKVKRRARQMARRADSGPEKEGNFEEPSAMDLEDSSQEVSHPSSNTSMHPSSLRPLPTNHATESETLTSCDRSERDEFGQNPDFIAGSRTNTLMRSSHDPSPSSTLHCTSQGHRWWRFSLAGYSAGKGESHVSWGKHVAGGEINCSPLRTRTWRFHYGERTWSQAECGAEKKI